MASVLIHAADESVTLTARAVQGLLERGDGDAALLYLALLRRHGAVAPRALAGELRWDRGRIEAAEQTLRELGLVAPAAESVPEPADERPEYPREDIVRHLDGDGEFRGLVAEVERKLGKKLTTPDLGVLLGLSDYLGLPADVIYLLVCHCAERVARRYGEGRRPRMSQIQKEAFVWRRLGVDTAQAAEAHLKKQALYRSREGEILRLLDQPPRPLVEKERKKVAAWTDMGFADEVLRLAYEKTVYKKQKMDWDYMNGILCGWHRKNLHTLAEVEAGDRQRRPVAQPAMQGRPAAPGEADQRVREDLERMREFLRRQQETEGE